MRCREVAQRAGAYIDGEAPRLTHWRIRLHLARCGDCARFVRQIALTRRTLGSAEPEPLAPAREDELVRAVGMAGVRGDGAR